MAYLDDNGEPLNDAPATVGAGRLPVGVTINPSTGYASGIVPDDPSLSANWQKTTNPDGSITAAPSNTPDLSTHEGQLAWVQRQLQGTKYANDDPNYWLGRINDTGGFTPDNLNYWGTNIKNEYWGSPAQVAGEAANNAANSALNPAPFSYPTFTDQFSNPSFQAPTGVDEQNDPGVGARLQLGSRALQQSAAAKGTLLTGQTLADLNDYAQNFASNEYGNVYNRALQTYQTNSANNFQQYQQKYKQYLNGYQQAASTYGTNLGAGQQAFGDTLALSAQNFGQNQQNWQNQYNLVGQQLGAAEALVNAGWNYANNTGSLYQQSGNAAAAGTVGGANAWTGALGGIVNYAQQLPYYSSSQYGSKPGGYANPFNGYGFSY